MPGNVGTDPKLAAQVMNMADAGYMGQQIANVTGLPASSVSEIIRKHGRWGEVADKPVFIALRQEQNKVLEAGYRTAAGQLLARAFDEDKLAKAGTYQLVVASGIAIDKARLLAGESTQNVSVHATHEIAALDKLCEMLGQALMTNDVIEPDK
jgi:hypothetical protein